VLQMATEAEMQMAENPRAGDDQLYVRFYTEPVQNAAKSIQAGRPIFDDTELVEIRVPGDKDMSVKGPAKMYKDRFPQRYAAFLARKDQDAASGTVLSQWPGCTRSQAEELAFLKCKTVEQLAALSDAQLQNFGPGYLTLRGKAAKWLEASKGNATVEKVNSELQARDSEIAVLKRALEEQNAKIAEIQSGNQNQNHQNHGNRHNRR
jgi:hypothetical protein